MFYCGIPQILCAFIVAGLPEVGGVLGAAVRRSVSVLACRTDGAAARLGSAPPVTDAPSGGHERQGGERRGGRHGLHRGAAAAAQEPERPAELQRRLVARHGAAVREEDDDPGRPEPREEPRRRPAAQQAGQPGRRAGAAAEGDGGAAAAGHVAAVPAVVAARVHPGVQGQRRLRPPGERVLRRGRRVLPGARGHAHRRAARRRGRRRHGGGQEGRRERRQLGLLPRLSPEGRGQEARGGAWRPEAELLAARLSSALQVKQEVAPAELAFCIFDVFAATDGLKNSFLLKLHEIFLFFFVFFYKRSSCCFGRID